MEKLSGTLNVWFYQKGYGFVVKENEGAPPSKYYLHISKILPGQPKPEIGAGIRFNVNPIREGVLPSAINVEIIPNESPVDGGSH
jgi:cold shock CspA family protein